MRKTHLNVIQSLAMLAICLNMYSVSDNNLIHEAEMEKKNQGKIYEIAVYKVKDAKAFAGINRQTFEHLSGYAGYLSSKTFRNLEDSNIFMDIIEWSTLEMASDARQKFENTKISAVKTYLSEITEMIYFDQVEDVADGFLKYNTLKKDDVLEFALIQVKDAQSKDYQNARLEVISHIGSNYEAFKEIQTLRSVNQPNLVVDLGRWESAEHCHLAQSELENAPVFLNFAQHIDMDEDILMLFFKQVR